MTAPPPLDVPLYVRIAENVTSQVASGALRPGDRVPSLRQLSRQLDVSVSTALQAYLLLETRGYLESRPQSGFYVRTPFATLIPEPRFETKQCEPTEITTNAILAQILETAADPRNVQFGVASASPELFPSRRLNLILRRILRDDPDHSARYDFGLERLRRQIARRALASGCSYAPEDVTVTSGGLEAINFSLRAVAGPGDVIAVETPCYFGILGSIASQSMKVIEIPTHPSEGMDLGELERAIVTHGVKAVVSMPNCHNPLGSIVSDERKRALVELTARYDVPLIEDDVYGDLAYTDARPKTLKSFDRKDLVLLCSSFSKILAPGYRIGWVVAGRYRTEIARLKLLTSVATPSLSQRAVAEFLESGGYDRHLKRMRATLARQSEAARQLVARYFPSGTRVTRPGGGHMLWIELPAKVNALKLYRAALEQHISILPGTLFSATGRYRNHIRINCGNRWSDVHERALETLGRLT